MAEVALDRHIESSPGVAGGKPCIAGHRITVQNIAIWHERLGISADEIATEFGLSLSSIYAALAYYYDNRDEIDKSIQDSEHFILALRQDIPSKLAQKLDLK